MVIGATIKFNRRGYAVLTAVLLIFLYFHFRRVPNRNQELISLVSLLQTSIQAAEEGGKLVVATRNYLTVQLKGKTHEGMDDSVTTADFLSHCIMERIITSAYPSVQFISEEKNVACDPGGDFVLLGKPEIKIPDIQVKASDVTVWIDPLDATHEYTEKLYEYVTTMVCVAVKGEPILGVIHNPFKKTLSWAIVGRGVSNNLKEPLIKDKGLNKKVIISRSHSGTIKEVLGKVCKDCEIVIAAGAGYKALKVAKGDVDAYLHITAIKKWDVCAGHAILNALGGKVTTKHGKKLLYGNDSDVIIQDGLIATLKDHGFFVDKL
ncbi:hypothetical protein ABEB36_000754 [Hypothenemus hampei]|uniref:inositol-phosphate phosphatase n=1 Tax=Hypothenemus hampei TaxID=57062 RepID=A0ABD1FE83_HYPHA